MSSSELTSLSSERDEDPGPRHRSRRIATLRKVSKIDRHVQPTSTRATQETKRVNETLESKDELSDNMTTPTRRVPSEKSAQSPPRISANNSAPKPNQPVGPLSLAERIKLNVSPISTRNPKEHSARDLRRRGGAVATADSGSVASASGIKMVLRNNLSDANRDLDREVNGNSTVPSTSNTSRSSPPRGFQKRLVSPVPAVAKPHSVGGRGVIVNGNNIVNIRQPPQAQPEINLKIEEESEDEIQVIEPPLLPKRLSRSPASNEASDEDPSGIATTVLSPELATPSTLAFPNQYSPKTLKHHLKGFAEPVHDATTSPTTRTRLGNAPHVYPSTPDNPTTTKPVQPRRSPSAESDSSISVISVRKDKGKERAFAMLMPVFPAQPSPTVAPMVKKKPENQRATSIDPTSPAVGPPQTPSTLASTPSSAASRSSSGSTIGPRDLTPWRPVEPIDAAVQSFTVEHLRDRARMASITVQGTWTVNLPPPGCARRQFGVPSSMRAQAPPKARRSAYPDSPLKGRSSNANAQMLTARSPMITSKKVLHPAVTVIVDPVTIWNNRRIKEEMEPEENGVIVISSSEDESDGINKMNRENEENVTEDEESPNTPQLTQTTHDRQSSVGSSINQRLRSGSEFEIVGDSEEEPAPELPRSAAITSPRPVKPHPRKRSKASNPVPSGDVLDHLRRLSPPLPIFEPFSDPDALQFPGQDPIRLSSSIESQSSFAFDYAPVFSFAQATPLDVDTGTTFYARIKDKGSRSELVKPFPQQFPGPRRVFVGVEIKMTAINRNYRKRRALRFGVEDHSEEDELLLGEDEGEEEIQRARKRWKMEQARKRAIRASKQVNLQGDLPIYDDNFSMLDGSDDDDDEYESNLDERKRPIKKRRLDYPGSALYSPQYSSQNIPHQSFEPALSMTGSNRTVDAPYGISVEEINVDAIVFKSLQAPRQGKRASNPDAFCHQCRNTSTRGKPRSVCDHEQHSEVNGDPPLRCGKRFCVPCLTKWYGLDDDGLALVVRSTAPVQRSPEEQSKMIGSSAMRMGVGFGIVPGKWICPFCTNFCMCTQCVQKRKVPREAFRPSPHGRFQELAHAGHRRRLAGPRIIDRTGQQSGPPAVIKGRKRDIALHPPDRWLPVLPPQTEGLDPVFYQSTRPRTRDFPTGAPPPTAAHFAPIVVRVGAVLDDDGLDDSFTGDEHEHEPSAGKEDKDEDMAKPKPKPKPVADSNGGSTSGITPEAPPKKVNIPPEKRRNYAVVAPGSRLPVTKKAVITPDAFANASSPPQPQPQPQPSLPSAPVIDDSSALHVSPVTCLEPALTFAIPDTLSLDPNLHYDSIPLQDSQNGHALSVSANAETQTSQPDILNNPVVPVIARESSVKQESPRAFQLDSLPEEIDGDDHEQIIDLCDSVPSSHSDEDQGCQHGQTGSCDQCNRLPTPPSTQPEPADRHDQLAIAMSELDVQAFDPMELEYQLALEDDYLEEDFFDIGPKDTLLAMGLPTHDFVGTALGIPPEEVDVVSKPSPAIDPFDFGSTFFD